MAKRERAIPTVYNAVSIKIYMLLCVHTHIHSTLFSIYSTTCLGISLISDVIITGATPIITTQLKAGRTNLVVSRTKAIEDTDSLPAFVTTHGSVKIGKGAL